MLLSDLSKLVNGTLSNGSDDVEILRVAKIEDAAPGDVTFLANLKYKKYLVTTGASAVLLARNSRFDELAKRKSPLHLIFVDDPYSSFLKLIDIFHPPVTKLLSGIAPTAIIAKTAVVGANVAIGDGVIVAEGCRIGKGTTLHPGCLLGEGVTIGEETTLYPGVIVREQCRIGNSVIVHSGAVIGSDGFGFSPKPDGSYEKIPQRGIVVIEDDVEIGANCTIDRATIGETRICKGTKLDNLIHIAHNVSIGSHTVIAAQTGISGSTKVGDYCAIGGQVGLTGHIDIADHTSIGAQSGVPKSVTKTGTTIMGYPAREIREMWKIDAAARQLPELLQEFRKLQQRVEMLEQLLRSQHPSSDKT